MGLQHLSCDNVLINFNKIALIFRNWLNAKNCNKIRQLPTIERFSLTFRITWTSIQYNKTRNIKYTTRVENSIFLPSHNKQIYISIIADFSWIYLLNESERIHLSAWFIVLYCIERNKSNSILWNCGVLADTGVCRYIASNFFFLNNITDQRIICIRISSIQNS